MADEKEIYELAPVDPDKPVTLPVVAPPGTPGRAGPSSGASVFPPGAVPGSPGKGALLDDFDDDADFSKDPEVERALKGVRGAMAGEAKAGDTRPVFVKPGAGTAQVWLVVGAVLLLGAAIAAAINATHHWPVAALLVIYNACLHTVSGVGAVAAGALLTEKRVGSLTLAGARMLVAVSAFLLVWNLKITILGSPENHWEEWTLATLVYVGGVAALFKIWGRELGYVVCSHFMLWIVVHIGMWLSEMMAQAQPAAG